MKSLDEQNMDIFCQYPLDLSPLLQNSPYNIDEFGIPYCTTTSLYHPTIIAQFALVQWNLYLSTLDDRYRKIFLAQAYWLVEHQVSISENTGGWPVSFALSDIDKQGFYLSALTQGHGLSVLVRAYTLTQEKGFLNTAHRAVRTFEKDIFDGGVSTPIGPDGVFFEEIAIYPATHMLHGFLFALFGLYDYVSLTHDSTVKKYLHYGLTTLQSFLDEFDQGFWVCTDLRLKHLASPFQLTFFATLLEILAEYTTNSHYKDVALKWRNYQKSHMSHLRYLVTHATKWIMQQLQRKLYPPTKQNKKLDVCIVIASFPFVGGVLTVLRSIAYVTKDIWHIEYLTQYVGPDSEHYVIHRFGVREMTSPWYFPLVWLYVLTGFITLLSLLSRTRRYSVVMPQDGFFTGAFVTLAAKLVGVNVVCFDHGELNLLIDRNRVINRTERSRNLKLKRWPKLIRFFALKLLGLYWPSRYVLALITARLADHYLIPGVSGDGIDEVCKQLGVPLSRITRFANMIDLNRHIAPSFSSKAHYRQKIGIDIDTIVISIICRLAPEKGLEISIAAIRQALSMVPSEIKSRVRIIIGGDGPLRKQLEEDIAEQGLQQICLLWGEASKDEVVELLATTDIFLYTSWRGAGYPLSILEAMASGCAVVATTEPLANIQMLAEERGITVAPGDIEQTRDALFYLLTNREICQRMGKLAREYVATYHSPQMFKRMLMRTTDWSNVEALLRDEVEGESDMSPSIRGKN